MVTTLLDLVGVDRATIVEDYVQTMYYMQNLTLILRRAAAQIGFDLERLDRMLECRANVMERTLRYINER